MEYIDVRFPDDERFGAYRARKFLVEYEITDHDSGISFEAYANGNRLEKYAKSWVLDCVLERNKSHNEGLRGPPAYIDY